MERNPFSEQEIQQFRNETSGTAQKIHFNNAGASLPPDVVLDTVIGYLKIEATQGGYETEYNFRDSLENTYALIARLINADKGEIALVENASIAWGLAFNGIDFKKDDEVITSEMEYVTNLIGFLNAEKLHGIKLNVIPNDEQGNFSLSALEKAITSRTRLIAITHIPSSAGNILPVAEIGRIARKHNILYLVDACQSIGQVPVDVKEIGCDMLAVTGRKYLRAPRGTGFLYVRKEIRDQLKVAHIDGHTAELITTGEFKLRDDGRRFEVYERNRALTLGLAKAVEYALHIGLDRITQRIQYLGSLLRR
ncbi:MAG TPA: aminotransferase class V-fold PLP-dependent enzyme, partial [Puia sp.]|nr:aminotransferase class V-fold PLP-dependent enzyme [Puia sp.]